ncbi:MAG: hypothetical protein V7744_08735 [Pseudomonadales bacterium]
MNLRKLAAFLMIYSGISHPSQLLIYGTDDPQLVTPALIGTSFFFIGLFLLSNKRAALWVGAIIPLLFGLGASYRLVTQDPNIMTYIHTAIDFIVSPLCFYLLFQGNDKQSAST